jgi:DNA-binding MarR family transcriptional regulator
MCYNKLVEFTTSCFEKGKYMQERFQTFTILIARLNRYIRKIKTEEMAEFNLKSPHVSCLYYLYKADSLTAKELCDICEEDKANISRSIEFLEKNGYLVCRSRTEKRYKSPLVLTEKGKAAGEHIVCKIDAILDSLSEGVPDEDRAIMYRSLSVICDNLQKICDAYGDS